MNKELQIFNFNDNSIYTILDDDNNIWFLAKDVCNILGLDNVTKAVSRLDEDELQVIDFKALNLSKVSTKTDMRNIINESGLYSLVLTSIKPEAKAFKKFVTSEILPTIRKTGSYSMQPKELSRLEILTMAIEAEKKVLLLESKIEEDKPKVELANDLIDSTGLTPIKLAAKELGIPPMTFFKMLRVDGIIDSHNIMYQRFINSGLGEIKVTTKNNKMFSSTLFTPKGLLSLHKKYKDYKKVQS